MIAHVEGILKQFTARYSKDKNVLGIILTGSYVYGILDKNSDLDICIITKNSKTLERGSTWVDNVEIDYFISPLKQIEAYFQQDKTKQSRNTAHMLANSQIGRASCRERV